MASTEGGTSCPALAWGLHLFLSQPHSPHASQMSEVQRSCRLKRTCAHWGHAHRPASRWQSCPPSPADHLLRMTVLAWGKEAPWTEASRLHIQASSEFGELGKALVCIYRAPMRCRGSSYTPFPLILLSSLMIESLPFLQENRPKVSRAEPQICSHLLHAVGSLDGGPPVSSDIGHTRLLCGLGKMTGPL